MKKHVLYMKQMRRSACTPEQLGTCLRISIQLRKLILLRTRAWACDRLPLHWVGGLPHNLHIKVVSNKNIKMNSLKSSENIQIKSVGQTDMFRIILEKERTFSKVC